jgi:hypothetical protein
MRESDTALGHHLDEVAVAQLVGEIPSEDFDFREFQLL